jgi:hypothetical protein
LVTNIEVPIFRDEPSDSQILFACPDFDGAKTGSQPIRLSVPNNWLFFVMILVNF